MEIILLIFKTKAWLEGKGRLSVNCFVENPEEVEQIDVVLKDFGSVLSLNDDRGQIYSPVILGTAEVDCGNYLITIFINDKKVITDFIEIQNKRETVYNYHYDEKTNVYPVKFLLDDGKEIPVEFGEGKTIDTYTTGGDLPDPATITNILDSCEFWNWYCDGKKITKLPENTKRQVIVKARYGMSVTNAADLEKSLENGVRSFKITPEDQYYWTKLEESIKDEEITVILDLTNAEFENNTIENGYFGGTFTPTVTEIVIPASVTEIEGSAFYECTQLESVTFAEGSALTSLGRSAFAGCSSLQEITIPKGVTKFNEHTFNGCTSLKKIAFEKGSQIQNIGDRGMLNCTSLEEIVIPASVEKIGVYAFNNCTNLKKVTIEKDSKLTIFNEAAFNGCTNLESVIFEGNSSLESIGQTAFANCSQLADFVIPSTVTSIAGEAFDGCSRLTSKAFSENPNLESIGYAAFYNCISLTSFVIPSGVTYIDNTTFSGCTNLKTVTFAENSKLETIYGSAFANCTSLTEIVIPETVTSIASKSFDGCTNLKNFTIPSGVVGTFKDQLKSADYKFKVFLNGDVDSSTFFQNLGLVEVEISGNVTKINRETFKGCKQLKTVTFAKDSGLTIIDGTAFCECESLEKIEIPASVTTLGSSAFASCKNLKTVTFAKDSKLKEFKGYVFQFCSSLEEISIPASVKSLGSCSVFNSCKKLKKVTFEGNNITEIPFETFSICVSLEEITIPSSVDTIGFAAFSGCTNLKEVTYLGDKSKITFGDNVFKDTQIK